MPNLVKMVPVNNWKGTIVGNEYNKLYIAVFILNILQKQCRSQEQGLQNRRRHIILNVWLEGFRRSVRSQAASGRVFVLRSLRITLEAVPIPLCWRCD